IPPNPSKRWKKARIALSRNPSVSSSLSKVYALSAYRPASKTKRGCSAAPSLRQAILVAAVSVAVNTHRNLLRLRFRRLRHVERQHAVVERSFDLVGNHRLRQADSTAEPTISTLKQECASILRIARLWHFTRNRQRTIVDADVDAIRRNAGERGNHVISGAGFMNVQRQCK